jgi:hypothetical protein
MSAQDKTPTRETDGTTADAIQARKSAIQPVKRDAWRFEFS